MTLLKNLEWGLRWGLTIAAGFTVMGLIGNVGCQLDPSANCELSFGSLLGTYWIAGICGGIVLGLFRPITRHLVGEMVVGIFIVAVCLALLNYQYVATTDGWKLFDTIVVAVFSVLLGPIAALMMRYARSRKSKVPPEFHDF